MLEYAKKYEDKLRQLFMDITFDPFYKYQQNAVYRDVLELPKDTWAFHHFVSLYQGDILGMIAYQVRRSENAVCGLNVIHFGGREPGNGFVFGKDVLTAVRDVFEKYGVNKINFEVAIGNPIEKTYDKLIGRYNGRIVGIKKQDTRLMDGKLYDIKEYEILAEEYFSGRQ
jgi:Flp pilus assembly secretin CpaC